MPKEKGEISAFNEGALQMQRIHELQSRVNNLNASPLFRDNETGKYYYELVFACLNSLFAEASSKLSKKELDEGIKLRKKIKNHINNKPVFKSHNEMGNIKTMIVPKNWNDIQELLFEYELKIRHYLEEHDLTAPKGDSPTEAAYK